ncbi:AraC family transcriptional regulator [Aminobacter sp. AP02]|uniref:helix-turn-helix transcriptional regulator n=1 Tax=Aminobacter sp. AP02 TaxID=2135737 RepID=UPI001304D6D2|nr:AraC family transcriptional regulator [Aminobacter sp. AP02]
MTMTPDASNEIFFHTPGRHANAYPYKILVAGRTRFSHSDGFVTRRFHHHTLIYTLSGLGLIEVSGNNVTAGPQTITWLDTSMQYAHGCHPEASHWHYLWMSIEGYGLDAVFSFLRVANNPLFAAIGEVSAGSFERAIDNLDRRGQTTDAISSTIVAQLVETLVAERGEHHSSEDRGERVLRVMREVRTEIASNWRIEELAAISSLSASQLHRQFKEKTGTTPMDWIRHERMNLAKRLLTEPGAKIATVALACGYADPYHFSRDFRRIAGQSPSEFRRAQGQ